MEFVGNLSVRKPLHDEKPIQMQGQDEGITKQNIFLLCLWTVTDSAKPLVSKGEGSGVLLSALASRELCFGFVVSIAVLDEVDEKRKTKTTFLMKKLQEYYLVSSICKHFRISIC